MRRFVIITLAIVALVALAVILPAFTKARAYSGPSIYGVLYGIHLAKVQWLADGGTNEWPTTRDLYGWETNRPIKSTRYGEIYFINRTGAPPFAYIPKAVSQFRGGEILVLTSNGVMIVRQ